MSMLPAWATVPPAIGFIGVPIGAWILIPSVAWEKGTIIFPFIGHWVLVRPEEDAGFSGDEDEGQNRSIRLSSKDFSLGVECVVGFFVGGKAAACLWFSFLAGVFTFLVVGDCFFSSTSAGS